MAEKHSQEMQGFLYEKRNGLSIHSKALLALATHKLGSVEQTKMLRQNIEQFLVEDEENQTAYLRNEASWWYWYGGSIEATALYLKLLTQLDPKEQRHLGSSNICSTIESMRPIGIARVIRLK